jgi:hypothetical protein
MDTHAVTVQEMVVSPKNAASSPQGSTAQLPSRNANTADATTCCLPALQPGHKLKTVEHWTPLDVSLAAENFCTNDTPTPGGTSTTCILALLIPSCDAPGF